MDLKCLGIDEKKISLLKKKNINNVEDLIYYFPRKYYDFSKITPIKELKHEELCAVTGIIVEKKSFPKFIKIKIQDSDNSNMDIIWFIPEMAQNYHLKILEHGKEFIFCGKINFNEQYKTIQMLSPLFFDQDINKYKKIIPIYPKTKGINDEFLQNVINSALAVVDKNDYLEPFLLNKYNLQKYSSAIRNIHQPKNLSDIDLSKRRFLFDDLFYFIMQLTKNNKSAAINSEFLISKMSETENFIKNLPFELTEDQSNILEKMYKKIKNKKRLNALVQGDVSCGKTILSFILMILMWENKFQSVLMCPTKVLAEQHYMDIIKLTKNIPCNIALLKGNLSAKETKIIQNKLASGEIDILIGTHSVISKNVIFKNLALTIIDEEHRFGVEQRNLLKEKASLGVHNISMSATPIPRTLATTIYGDNVEIFTINKLPKGRLPVKTVLFANELKVFEAMHRQIKEGRQCYVICPLIKTSKNKKDENGDEDKFDKENSVVDTFKKLEHYFSKYNIRVGMVSGDNKTTKAVEVTETLNRFFKNEIQILVSTTVIEVGVNVPNASVIVIKNAEKFGLSQLHQLRGRVGRGIHQSYCVLLSCKKNNEKLKIMCETNNGFKIAEEDLRIRGSGNLIGTEQSGFDKYVEQAMLNESLYNQLKREIDDIFSDKSRLNKYANMLYLE